VVRGEAPLGRTLQDSNDGRAEFGAFQTVIRDNMVNEEQSNEHHDCALNCGGDGIDWPVDA